MAEDKEKAAEAAKIIRNHMLGAIGAGFVPVPLLDAAIFTGIQFRMLGKLAALYEVEFYKQIGNSAIASLVGVSFTTTAGSLLKMLPGVGAALGAISVPTFAGASTYAIGHVFVRHFESGGTFLTFDPKKAKKYYGEKYEEGKRDIEKNYAGVKP